MAKRKASGDTKRLRNISDEVKNENRTAKKRPKSRPLTVKAKAIFEKKHKKK